MRSVRAAGGWGVAYIILITLTSALLGVPQLAAQTTPRRNPASQRPLPRPTTPSSAEQPKFKGVWEPINYKEDVEFTDVYFVTREEGWASGLHRTDAGEGGFILHTRDGGQSWETQLGDPHSAIHSIQQLLFVDKTHGWATQWGGEMLRTTDGETWESIGKYPTLSPYAFASTTIGISLRGEQIFQTQDGGKTWKSVFASPSHLVAAQMPSPKIGYAVCKGAGDVAFELAKTVDGGTTWTLTPARVPGTMGSDGHVYFLDEQTGFVSLYKWGGTVYVTNDGGATWRAVIGMESSSVKFADPETGWSIQGNHPLTYTVDGGKRWLSRQIPFPGFVSAFSLPRRDRGYVVGQHGMIYRYRLVPASYQATAHSIDAPLMASFDSTVPREVATLNDVVAQLRAKLPAVTATTGQAEIQPSAQPRGQASVQASAQAAAFQQDTNTPSSTGASTVPGGAPAGTAGGFQQDLGSGPVPGGYMDSCCGPLIQQLETTANSFATNVPTYSRRFRNLNLMLEGLNLVNNVVGQANTLKQSVRALRRAPNQQAAAIALTNVQSQLNGISSSGGFVQDTSLPPQP